ncbi:MAG TPA: class C sortase [Cerasibacillus sp.]|uniref:class C sortase n=1 Tax=Cerasibacillus sp. TaxID=2498711 RepID=UPI002F406794
MKKWLLIIIFFTGLGVFSYPIVSNLLSTKVHQSVVEEYTETVKEMDKEEIENERKKADKHNEKLEDAQLDFVDPFSEETTEERKAGNKSYYDALNIGPAIGTLEIPKINTNLPIYHGSSDDVLSQGVGHLENSSLPTGKPGTHSVLTAHRGLPSSKLFRHLDEMEVGDEFYVQVLDETYAYQVFDVEIVLPHQTEWLQMSEDEEIVTLLTCEPYMINTHRMLVKGKRVPYNPAEKEAAEASELPWLYIVVIAIVVLLVLFILYRRRKKKARIKHEEV